MPGEPGANMGLTVPRFGSPPARYGLAPRAAAEAQWTRD
jgi:hypothetical protein